MAHLRVRVASFVVVGTFVLGIGAAPVGAQTGELKITPVSGPQGTTVLVSSISPCGLPRGVTGAPFARITMSQGSTIIASRDFTPAAAGNWSGTLTVGSRATPGTATVGGDCIADPQAEGSLLHYSGVAFTVTSGSTTTTSTLAPTTTLSHPSSSSQNSWALYFAILVAGLAVIGGSLFWRRRPR